ncbi:MAG: ADP-ribosylglycohydrolase family protein [Dehalococcoidia bacterium]|nr:MAG: ADP-ribosylglycohydrolase family protein [Dehalococcoidia bacterium]
MLGAIAGDIIGSSYEWHCTKAYNFELFTARSSITDDTILTVAVADCILHDKDYAMTIKEYGKQYPYGGYGAFFHSWLGSDSLDPYWSFGNGSAMRVSPVGFAFESMDTVLEEAKKSAEVTHNHPEGIKGAQAIAASIFMAREGTSKEKIRGYIEEKFGYNLHVTLEEIRPYYMFDETCQGSVPQAIIAFLESEGYEDAVRKAVSLGGDSDTIACMAGGIAQAYYGVILEYIKDKVRELIPTKLLAIVDEFNKRYKIASV